jgi:hypothetical protein
MARPGVVTPQPGRSLAWVLLYAVLGWTLCAATMGFLLAITTAGAATWIHAFAAPLIFAVIAGRYFRLRGARDPLPTAWAFVSTVALLDLAIVAGVIQHSFAMFGSIVGSWLPFLLIFLVTWAVGEITSTLPWPKPPRSVPIRAVVGS